MQCAYIIYVHTETELTKSLKKSSAILLHWSLSLRNKWQSLQMKGCRGLGSTGPCGISGDAESVPAAAASTVRKSALRDFDPSILKRGPLKKQHSLSRQQKFPLPKYSPKQESGKT